MPISDALKRIYTSAPDNEYYIETLALEHPLFTGGVRYITNNRDGWTGDLEGMGGSVKFAYVPFAAVPPDQAEQAAVTLKVAIDNASRSLMDELELLATQPTSPIIITYRVYLASDSTTVQNDPPLQLEILAVTANQEAISFNAGLVNLRSRPFPSVLYSTERYPGLVR